LRRLPPARAGARTGAGVRRTGGLAREKPAGSIADPAGLFVSVEPGDRRLAALAALAEVQVVQVDALHARGHLALHLLLQLGHVRHSPATHARHARHPGHSRHPGHAALAHRLRRRRAPALALPALTALLDLA